MEYKEKALSLFREGYNCSQAVVCAYAEVYGVEEVIAFRMAQGFGGGIGGSGGICGAVSGMVMVASLQTCPKQDINHPSKQHTYQKVKAMVEAFRIRNEYINCSDLLKYKNTTLVDGKKACCQKCVSDCCDIIEEFLDDKISIE